MLLFFAAIEATLFFWGRSIGLSVTSTTMTLQLSLWWGNSFLPGKRNLPELINKVSTFCTSRHTAYSLSLQLVAIWNWVRYSRQYSSANSNWSSTLSLHCPPRLPLRSRLGRSTSFICSKVSGCTPHLRLKALGLWFLNCSWVMAGSSSLSLFYLPFTYSRNKSNH